MTQFNSSCNILYIQILSIITIGMFEVSGRISGLTVYKSFIHQVLLFLLTRI